MYFILYSHYKFKAYQNNIWTDLKKKIYRAGGAKKNGEMWYVYSFLEFMVFVGFSTTTYEYMSSNNLFLEC